MNNNKLKKKNSVLFCSFFQIVTQDWNYDKYFVYAGPTIWSTATKKNYYIIWFNLKPAIKHGLSAQDLEF